MSDNYRISGFTDFNVRSYYDSALKPGCTHPPHGRRRPAPGFGPTARGVMGAVMGTNAGTKLKENYDICEKLGSGNFATVKKAKRKVPTDEIPADVAVKIIDKSKVEDMEDIEREIHIMKTIKHEHVVVMYEVYDEPKKMHLIMELITGGELFDRIVLRTSYTERNAADVMKELASALEHIHAKGVVHRDLKPENILLKNRSDDAGIKVADFGLARVMSKKRHDDDGVRHAGLRRARGP